MHLTPKPEVNVMSIDLFKTVLLENIRENLISRKEKVAVAESVTSGFLQLAFSGMKDGVRIYDGGITCYNLVQKVRHLSVDPRHAEAVNCVSAKVAAEMAVNVAKMFSSDWGIGITGYATPVRESGNEVFAFFSIAYRGTEIEGKKINHLIDEPLNVQLAFTNEVLDQFLSCFDKRN